MLSMANYAVAVALLMIGLFIVITSGNLVKKVIGLIILQSSVFVMYISIAYVQGGSAPVLSENLERYVNPLPHVLILTAIVVGVSTTALALALVVRIRESFGSIEEDEIRQSVDDG